MKRQTINFSWPATLSFSTEKSDNESERFSRGKLAVFYKGETADHRYFSDEFSDKLIKSLPYTPVVSYYDEEKDDFVGHATEQAIYGIVDPCGEVSFEERDDGNTWAVCDTILYTERPDKVGEIAKKIEGHSQSLELDPKTAKYVVNYDEKRHFKNIEFTDGHFVGVSVLGSDQKPAFTGSEFFACDTQFEEKMKLLKEYCEQKGQETQPGGQEMDLKEFITLSWGDKATKVDEAITDAYKAEYFCYVVDMFDDCAIGRFYSYLDGSSKLLRVKYSIDENGVVTLGDANEVHVVYEDVPQPASTNASVSEGVDTPVVTPKVENAGTTPEVNTDASATDCACGDDKDKNKAEDKPEDDGDGEDKPKDGDEPKDGDDKPEQCAEQPVATNDAATSSETPTAENAAQMTNAQNTETEVGAGNEQNEETNSGSATLTDSERAEFEALKREKKENLVNSYKDKISEEEFDGFFAAIDAKTYEELEVELLRAYKTNAEEQSTKVSRAFSLSALLNRNSENKESSLVSSIKYYLDK